jgi:hypothetical protein
VKTHPNLAKKNASDISHWKLMPPARSNIFGWVLALVHMVERRAEMQEA